MPEGMFQFTCPSRSTTGAIGSPPRPSASFNSRAPRGARPAFNPSGKVTAEFQFTCPSRSTTIVPGFRGDGFQFQFTCPSRSTTGLKRQSLQYHFVSIHVPLAEHDAAVGKGVPDFAGFNSRAPRGARPLVTVDILGGAAFQFTCPSRSTTDLCRVPQQVAACFNSRAPRGARPPASR